MIGVPVGAAKSRPVWQCDQRPLTVAEARGQVVDAAGHRQLPGGRSAARCSAWPPARARGRCAAWPAPRPRPGSFWSAASCRAPPAGVAARRCCRSAERRRWRRSLAPDGERWPGPRAAARPRRRSRGWRRARASSAPVAATPSAARAARVGAEGRQLATGARPGDAPGRRLAARAAAPRARRRGWCRSWPGTARRRPAMVGLGPSLRWSQGPSTAMRARARRVGRGSGACDHRPPRLGGLRGTGTLVSVIVTRRGRP